MRPLVPFAHSRRKPSPPRLQHPARRSPHALRVGAVLERASRRSPLRASRYGPAHTRARHPDECLWGLPVAVTATMPRAVTARGRRASA
jgi:hypothetical protein